MKALTVGVCLLLAAGAGPPSDGGEAEPSLDRLAWLGGCWGAEESRGSAEECWMQPKAGLMLGVHRDVSPSGQLFFEFLRIEARDGDIVYLASPKGRPATPFALARLEERSVTFENPEHDFPQRIRYSRDAAGQTLTVRIGTVDGKGKAVEWTWHRRPAGEAW
jgi:hypothetical protein